MNESDFYYMVFCVFLLLLVAIIDGKDIWFYLEVFGLKLRFFTKSSSKNSSKKLQQCTYCKQQVKISRFNIHLEKCPARTR